MRRGLALALAAAALLLAGCQTEPFRTIHADFKRAFGGAKGEPALKAGIQQYEEGRYADAARQLQAAISQGLSTPDEVRAHKYLAFIHCVSDRVAACREEFRKALSLNPGLELSAAEAGHPIWGPVFRAVKAGR
ncbi:MAG: TssQ family T6SS-associated lipoprotein [Betaproteobacteria bacterium]|nr:TssQ family T6SS-associated lipoprotein [Betaproteobacteria bacterium]MDH5220618.1 TssQ family T6SS-associated lipoprotein [Betaproteobacteria bacterium]MDH5350301.1 TssQ family T6SS-associated lipoprotein [Betaproteobacteria bacterium]